MNVTAFCMSRSTLVWYHMFRCWLLQYNACAEANAVQLVLDGRTVWAVVPVNYPTSSDTFTCRDSWAKATTGLLTTQRESCSLWRASSTIATAQSCTLCQDSSPDAATCPARLPCPLKSCSVAPACLPAHQHFLEPAHAAMDHDLAGFNICKYRIYKTNTAGCPAGTSSQPGIFCNHLQKVTADISSEYRFQ